MSSFVRVSSFNGNPYLRGDAVEAAAPEHLALLQLHLAVVDLIRVLHLFQLLLGDLLLLPAVTRCRQELQPASGDTGHQLGGRPDTNITPRSDATASLPVHQYLCDHLKVGSVSID